MRTKTKIIISVCVAFLALVGLWLSPRPRIEVHGRFSEQDLIDLKRLARAEHWRDIQSDFRDAWRHELPRLLRRVIAERIIQIDLQPNATALATAAAARDAARAQRHLYVFEKTNQGWRLASPVFE